MECTLVALLETLAGGGLVVALRDGLFVVEDCTESAAEALGCPARESTDRPILDIFPVSSHAALLDAFSQALDTGEAQQFACSKAGGQEDGEPLAWQVVAVGPARFALALVVGSQQERPLADLRESEERYALSVEGANDGLWDWKILSNEVYFSPRWKAILGYEDDEIRNEFSEWERLVHPEDQSFAYETIERYLEGRDSHFESEFRMAHKAGGYRWILARATSVRDAEGRPTRMCGSHTDITERKEVEQQLREQVEFFERVAATSLDAMVTMDDMGRVVFWNDAAARIFGYAREEIVGRELHELVAPPEQRKRFEAAFGHFKETGEGGAIGHVLELSALRADGTRVPVELSLAAVRARGAWWGVALARDISDRKAQERSLRDAQRRAEAILGAVHAGIVIVDPSSRRMTEVNDVAAELIGLPVSVLKDAPCGNHICPPEDHECPWESAGDAIIGRESVIRNAAGDEIPVVKSVVPFLHEGRRLVVESMVDIRPQKRIQGELREAVAAAEAATRAKSEFLANMSHEIRTPMNAIIGMTHLTMDSPLTVDQRENLEIVERSAESLLALINDILDFSKIDAGRLVIEDMDYDLRDLVEGAVDILAMRAEEKGIEIACLFGTEVPRAVRGDPNRLRQVLLNLLGNAVKFTEQGEVVLRVVADIPSRGKGRLHFAVNDTGIGIPSDKLSPIFESFAQADGSVSRRFGGTGLGLTISQRLVNLMGGIIGVESELGVGSTFSFDLPLVFAQHTSSVLDLRPSNIKGKRVLVCDDNETTRTVLDKMLAGWGCEATLVEGGEEALAQVRRAIDVKRPFDMLLLDQTMPGLAGKDTARRLSAEIGERRPSVLLLSSVASRLSSEELRAVGVEGYLTKPLKAKHVFEAMSEIMESGHDGHPASTLVTTVSLDARALDGVYVLLVEDQPFNQKVAAKFLQRRGVRVAVADNGEEAVRAATSERYDAILMDVQMPVLDGLEASRRIRLWERAAADRGRVPIIAMTAHAMVGDRERCLDAGMDDYLTKPLRPESLFDALDRWTKSGPASSAFGGGEEQRGGARVIELAGVRDRFGDDPSFMAELLEIYRPQIREQIGAMREALVAGDGETLRRTAHAAKGSSNNFGLAELGDLLASLETFARSGELAAAEGRLESVEGLVEPILEALAELVAELSS